MMAADESLRLSSKWLLSTADAVFFYPPNSFGVGLELSHVILREYDLVKGPATWQNKLLMKLSQSLISGVKKSTKIHI
ncbi:hypothetical protein Tco_0796345 [Tanacetum coccineum]